MGLRIVLLLWLLSLFVVNGFIINNKYVNKDGLKVFTVSSEIKQNNCSCSCNCYNDQLPLDKPIPAPQPPIASAPKQFIIKKLIHNNSCNCACSCSRVPKNNEQQEVSEVPKTTTPSSHHQSNEVRSEILDKLKTTLEQYWPSTTPSIVTQTTTPDYYTTTESPSFDQQESAIGYVTEPPQTTRYWTQQPEISTTGYATGPPPFSSQQPLSSVWLTNPWSSIQSTNQQPFNPFSTTQTPATLPTLPTIQWPFPTIANPFAPPSTTQTPSQWPSSNAESFTGQTLNPQSQWPTSQWPNSQFTHQFEKTKSSGTTGQSTNSRWPNQSSTQANNPTKNPWSSRGGPQTNGWQSTEIGPFPTSTQNPQSISGIENSQSGTPIAGTSSQPLITTDNEISTTLDNNRNDENIPSKSSTLQNFADIQTTNEDNRQSTISWTKQSPNENSFVPGLEISPGNVDASFTKTVAITSTKLDSSPHTSPSQEISGDTHSTTIAIKSPINSAAEQNDQQATTIAVNDNPTTATISPEFKEKVHTLLERLKLQLQKMKNEENAAKTQTSASPETNQQELDDMRVDLQQILASNSVNSSANLQPETKSTDKKELMHKLDTIRGMLDKMKARTTKLTIDITTLTPSQNDEQLIEVDDNSVQSTLIKSSSTQTTEQMIDNDKNEQRSTASTLSESTTITPSQTTQSTLSQSTQTTEQTVDNDSIWSSAIAESLLTQTTSHVDQQQSTTITPRQSTTEQLIKSTSTSPNNQDFLQRLHEKLMTLKERLDSMRHQSNSTTNTPVESTTTNETHDFSRLNAQLANIKNSFDSAVHNKEDDSEVLMKQKMQEMLDQLKQKLNTMQNEHVVEEQRTTIRVINSLSSTITTTLINNINNVESTTKDQKIEVDFDNENTPEIATQNAITQPSTISNDLKKSTTTKGVLPEAELEAKQSTGERSSMSTAKPTSKQEETPKPIKSVVTEAPSTISTSTETPGPAFVQQKDEDTTIASTKIDVKHSTPISLGSKSETSPESTTVQSTTIKTTKKPTNIRRKPTNDEEIDSSRRGLEITKIFRSNQSSKPNKVDFNRDEEEDSFSDMGLSSGDTTKLAETTTLKTTTTRKRRPKTTKTSLSIETTTQMDIDDSSIRRKTVAQTRAKLIDTIINSSTRLIGESMQSTNFNNVPKMPSSTTGIGVPQDLLNAAQQLQNQEAEEKSRASNKIRPNEIENWIRKSPQRNVSKSEASTQLPNEVPLNGFGFTPASDSQLFSLINRLMKIQPPVAASEVNTPSEEVGITPQMPTNNQVQRIHTTNQEIPLQPPPQRPRKVRRKKIEIKLNAPTVAPQLDIDVRQTTPREFRLVTKSSREFYDDYEEHDPTLAPETPTRTPKYQHVMTSTVESRPLPKLSNGEESFSMDENSNVIEKSEDSQQPQQTVINEPKRFDIDVATTVSTQEQSLIKRLDEARRLREKLEKSVLEENAANSGIHFQSDNERRQEIEAKLVKLAEAERRRRILLEKAKLNQQLNQQKMHDNEVHSAPTAKPISSTSLLSGTTQSHPTVPSHCQSVLKFVQMYQVSDPRVWIHENCEHVRQFYPGASCAQIEDLLSVCFSKQA